MGREAWGGPMDEWDIPASVKGYGLGYGVRPYPKGPKGRVSSPSRKSYKSLLFTGFSGLSGCFGLPPPPTRTHPYPVPQTTIPTPHLRTEKMQCLSPTRTSKKPKPPDAGEPPAQTRNRTPPPCPTTNPVSPVQNSLFGTGGRGRYVQNAN